MNQNNKVKVLFVCMGNICRSPTAHGVFQHLVNTEGLADQIEIDSAGTHAYHVGESPDQRAQQTASRHGVDLSYIRARKINREDFAHYDYILAMDEDNLYDLQTICPPQYQSRLHLFLEFASDTSERVVPDPYYGGNRGFEHVFKLVDTAAKGLLDSIKQQW